jgi:hypothetical protein
MSDPAMTINHEIDLKPRFGFLRLFAFRLIAAMQNTTDTIEVREFPLKESGKKLLYNFTFSGYPSATWQAYTHNTNNITGRLIKINPIINLTLEVE